MGSRKPKRGRSPRSPRKPAAVPLLRIHPRGPYTRRGQKWESRTYSDGWRWVQFRRCIGLENTARVALLLDVSLKTVRRYEYGGQPPRWYQAALIGLAAVDGGQDLRSGDD